MGYRSFNQLEAMKATNRLVIAFILPHISSYILIKGFTTFEPHFENYAIIISHCKLCSDWDAALAMEYFP